MTPNIEVLSLDGKADDAKYQETQLITGGLTVVLPRLRNKRVMYAFTAFLGMACSNGLLPGVSPDRVWMIVHHYFINDIFKENAEGAPLQVAIGTYESDSADILAAEHVEAGDSESIVVYNRDLLLRLAAEMGLGADHFNLPLPNLKGSALNLILAIGMSAIPTWCRILARKIKAGRYDVETGEPIEEHGNGNLRKSGTEVPKSTNTFDGVEDALISGIATLTVSDLFGGSRPNLCVLPLDPKDKRIYREEMRWNYLIQDGAQVGCLSKTRTYDIFKTKPWLLTKDISYGEVSRHILQNAVVKVSFVYSRASLVNPKPMSQAKRNPAPKTLSPLHPETVENPAASSSNTPRNDRPGVSQPPLFKFTFISDPKMRITEAARDTAEPLTTSVSATPPPPPSSSSSRRQPKPKAVAAVSRPASTLRRNTGKAAAAAAKNPAAKPENNNNNNKAPPTTTTKSTSTPPPDRPATTTTEGPSQAQENHPNLPHPHNPHRHPHRHLHQHCQHRLPYRHIPPMEPSPESIMRSLSLSSSSSAAPGARARVGARVGAGDSSSSSSSTEKSSNMLRPRLRLKHDEDQIKKLKGP
ncbi:hypothetical protein F5X96DRAFT_693521 [Biscogniauxia mediterranea]|nr:hypothetical protein F5X96DRAFT_693521 [Biscogniauxia mediterranea]